MDKSKLEFKSDWHDRPVISVYYGGKFLGRFTYKKNFEPGSVPTWISTVNEELLLSLFTTTEKLILSNLKYNDITQVLDFIIFTIDQFTIEEALNYLLEKDYDFTEDSHWEVKEGDYIEFHKDWLKYREEEE